MNATEIKPLLKKAQAAVEDMPNGELKTKAFEIVLQKLLESNLKDGGSTREVFPVKKQLNPLPLPQGKRADGPKGRITELHAEGLFKNPIGLNEVQKVLKERGFHYPVTTLGVILMRLTQARVLRRIRDSKKRGYQYANW